MGALKDESKVYSKLLEMYKKDITEQLYKDCVEYALKCDKRDLQYALFILKYINDEATSAFPFINSVLSIAKLTGNPLRTAFIMNVLEAALEEKKN